MPFKKSKKPRERFIKYYNDLYDLENTKKLHMNDFLKDNQYTFVELGNEILKLCRRDGILDKMDVILFSYWAHEYDPDHSFGAYLCNQHQIRVHTFDICDSGILSPLIAIKIIKSYFDKSAVKKALLICFDQKGIPVRSHNNLRLPWIASVRAIIFENNKTENSIYKLNETKFFYKNGTCDYKHKNAIIIDKSSVYYSCPEIFTPLFKSAIYKNEKRNLGLYVKDQENSDVGVLCLNKCREKYD